MPFLRHSSRDSSATRDRNGLAAASASEHPSDGGSRAVTNSNSGSTIASESVNDSRDASASRRSSTGAGSEGASASAGGGLFRRLSSRARGRRDGSDERRGGAGGGVGGGGAAGAAGGGREVESHTTSLAEAKSHAVSVDTQPDPNPARSSSHDTSSKTQIPSTAVNEPANRSSESQEAHPQQDGDALSRDDVRALFSGAPHFTLETGHRHRSFPQAFFPFAAGLNVTDLQDRRPLSHESFALSTMHSHLPMPTLGETGTTATTGSTLELAKADLDKHDDVTDTSADLSKTVTRENCKFIATGIKHVDLQQPAGSGEEDDSIPPQQHARRRPMFDLSIYERPNMLSLHGIEPGTFGFHAFLERGVADGLNPGRDETVVANERKSKPPSDEVDALQRKTATEALKAMGHDSAAAGTKIGKHAPPVDRLALLQEGPKAWKRIGVREISLKTITERLALISELRNEVVSKGWHYTLLQKWSEEELGRHLFEELLFEPSSQGYKSGKGVEPGSKGRELKLQIEVLVKILTTPGAWLDFNLPKERLLFVLSLHTREPNGKNDVDHKGITSDSKRWLSLVQLLLAVELVIRLDAALRLGLALHSEDVEVSSAEIHRFNKLRNLKVDWDFVVARRFLDLCYVKKVPSSLQPPTQTPDAHYGGRGILDKLRHGTHPASAIQDWPFDCAVLPRNPWLMIEGLLNFAKDIGWDPESVSEMSVQLDRKLRSRKHEEREDMLAAAIEPLDHPHVPQHSRDRGMVELKAASAETFGGPLSHAWIRGPILPGFICCDLLMCALLENDSTQQAVRRLGNIAYPRVGFVLGNRSWWSKLCILAGVLAPAIGTRERMGWIGLPETLTPLDIETRKPVRDGWWLVVSKSLLDQHAEERIFDGDEVARQSSTLGVGKGHVLASEFNMLTDKDLHGCVPLRVAEVQLVLQRQDVQPDDDGQQVYEAAVTASVGEGATVSTDGKKEILTRLRYTVRFVAAHPCQPPHGHTRSHSLGGNPEHDLNSQPQPPLRHKRLESLPSHPLHQSFKYAIRSMAEMLATDDSSLPNPTGKKETDPVWIIDARGGWAREVLVRAWCASVGLHAIISRVGLVCLGCSVREAKALNIAIIVRVTR